jgi:hypothetical protein
MKARGTYTTDGRQIEERVGRAGLAGVFAAR